MTSCDRAAQVEWLDLDNRAVCLGAETKANEAASLNFAVVFSHDSARLAYDIGEDQASQLLASNAQPGQVRWM
jgi:hypothetical protein